MGEHEEMVESIDQHDISVVVVVAVSVVVNVPVSWPMA